MLDPFDFPGDIMSTAEAIVDRIGYINVDPAADRLVIAEALLEERKSCASSIVAKDAAVAKLRAALSKAADQLSRVHDDAFRQASGYGLFAADGRSFSCFELNKCSTAATEARAVLGGAS